MDDPDILLFEQWLAGDAAAGHALFARHFDGLYGFFARSTNGNDVEDLVQETFAGCLQGLENFRREAPFAVYLYRIAKYLLFAYWRKAAKARANIDFEEVSLASLSTSAGTRFDNARQVSRLRAAMRTLPLASQVLLDLSYFQKLPHVQLAKIFEVDPVTIRTRLSRVRDALEELLKSKLTTAQLEAMASEPDDDDG